MKDPTPKQDIAIRRLEATDAIPDPTIRPARVPDAAAILAVHIASIRKMCGPHYTPAQIEAWVGPKRREHYEQAMASSIVLVAERDGVIVGFGECAAAGTDGEVRALYLHPDHVGAGLGGQLLGALEDAARARGARAMHVCSSLNAIAFYERAGYARCGGRELEVSGGARLPCESMTRSFCAAPGE